VLEAIELDGVRSRGYAFQVELTYRAVGAGFRVAEVPITFRDRTLGSSKMSWRIAAEAAWLVPTLRRRSRHPSALRLPSRGRATGASALSAERRQMRA
jgi:dolichol-phosphate mannosyltransferase